MVMFVQEHPELEGVYNASSPHPVSNRELMASLRQQMNLRIGLPSPRWMLELGAIFIRTETELVLKSRWVIPDRMERQDSHSLILHWMRRLLISLRQITRSSS